MKYFRNKYSEVELTKKNNWADIYSAINNSTNEKVQLRILKRQSNNTNYINLITSKINELQGLKHENLIGINGINSFIENEGVYYYIETEYFNGKALSDRMILKSHTCKESLEIIKQVAKGLNEFHYRGLNYETLSAENIFINSQNVVKLDVLSYISQKYDEDEEYDDYEEVEEEIDNDIYAIGTILYQLITRDSDFKLKKLKKNIDDDEIYSMLYALTSKKKKYKYENLNAFLSDVNEHLQYLSSDYEQGVDGYEMDDEYEEDYEYKKSLIIKRFCACLAVVLVLGGGIKVMGLVKGNDDENETTIEMAIEKETTDEDVEKEEVEEVVEEEPTKEETDELQVEYYSDDTYVNNNSTANNNTSTIQKPTTNNNNNNSSNNNTSTTQRPTTNNNNNNSSNNNTSTTQKPTTNNNNNNNSNNNDNNNNNSGGNSTSGSSESTGSASDSSGTEGSNGGSQGSSGGSDSGSGEGSTGSGNGNSGTGGSNGGSQGSSGGSDSGSGEGTKEPSESNGAEMENINTETHTQTLEEPNSEE